MKRFLIPLMALLGGGLLTLSWPETGSFTFLIFFAFIPFLWLEERLGGAGNKSRIGTVFGWSLLGFLVWNLGTCWWMAQASFSGLLLIASLHGLQMAIVFALYHLTKKRLGVKEGYAALLIYWLTWEWIQLEWDFAWPWLHLGNAFAAKTNWVQWYAFTGVSGGSTWVLIVNLLLYRGIKPWMNSANKRLVITPVFVGGLLLVFAPILTSWWMKSSYTASGTPLEVVAVQPNIESYTEKFNQRSSEEQVDEFLEIAAGVVTPETRLIVGPETMLPVPIRHDYFPASSEMEAFRTFQAYHPQVALLAGLSLLEGEQQYNAAFLLSPDEEPTYYRKQKLVPTIERTPYPVILGWTDALVPDPTPTHLDYQPGRESNTLMLGTDSIPLGTAICYESVFGPVTRNLVLNGAQLLVVITNDGWWGDTPGHRQHLAYARLRCISTRRSMVRSANTGISALIDQTGQIITQTYYGEKGGITGQVTPNDGITFFVKHGNILYRTPLFLSVLLLLLTVVRTIQGPEWRKRGK